jgi:hypothetical protein
MNPQTLSEKIVNESHMGNHIHIQDVKDFIKKLKYKLCNPMWCEDAKFNERWIDKLAGDKLI